MAGRGPGYGTIWRRAWRLRCPRCGEGKLFRGWFRMHEACAACGLDLRREPGFYLGSIYVNYGLTAVLTAGGYVGLLLAEAASPEELLAGGAAFCLVFPLWFFRYARSVWLAFDTYWDPPSNPPSAADQS